MSWRERDYTWFSESSDAAIRDWRSLLPPPGSTGLVVAHLTGFIIALLLRYGVSENAAESIALTNALNSWTVFTHPIATTNSLMLACALFAIWTLGARIEELLGLPRMLALYFGGNILAGLAYVVVARFWPMNASASLAEPVGGVAAWLITVWTMLPFENIALFGRFFTLRSVALTSAAVVAGLTVVQYGPGSTAWIAAACVGAAVAPVIDASHALFARRRYERSTEVERIRPNPARRDTAADAPPEIPEVDDLLEKISRSGIESLSDDERARLERARRARLERDRNR